MDEFPTELLGNEVHDEAHALDSLDDSMMDESLHTPGLSPQQAQRTSQPAAIGARTPGASPPHTPDMEHESDKSDDPIHASLTQQHQQQQMQMQAQAQNGLSHDSGPRTREQRDREREQQQMSTPQQRRQQQSAQSQQQEQQQFLQQPAQSPAPSQSSAGSAADVPRAVPVPEDMLYKPEHYAHLDVPNEVSALFEHIGRYEPHDVELDTVLHPFIPEFIPTVGDIDAFIKVPRPDNKDDGLGLTVLDEPSGNQSDPTVLDLQLRMISKKHNVQPMTVRSIEYADRNPQKITTWMNSIQDLHHKKPPPTVHYSRTMPDIESLMQVWPEQFEEVLKTTPLPSPELDMSVEDYSRVVCALLDIPVHDKVTESLHVLFTLYSEFKRNQHFQR